MIGPREAVHTEIKPSQFVCGCLTPLASTKILTVFPGPGGGVMVPVRIVTGGALLPGLNRERCS